MLEGQQNLLAKRTQNAVSLISGSISCGRCACVEIASAGKNGMVLPSS